MKAKSPPGRPGVTLSSLVVSAIVVVIRFLVIMEPAV